MQSRHTGDGRCRISEGLAAVPAAVILVVPAGSVSPGARVDCHEKRLPCIDVTSQLIRELGLRSLSRSERVGPVFQRTRHSDAVGIHLSHKRQHE